MKKNFILGVGAQKAGTTWLYEYLKNSENTNFGPVKEWHIWDCKYNQSFSNFRVKKEDSKTNVVNNIRYLMQNEEGFYEKYFLSLLSKNIHITGDITPSYCCLDHIELINIKNKLSNAGFNIKVVFLMRDPVARCWSALRMIKKINKKYKNITNQEANDLFLNYYNSNGFILRTKYELIVKNLLKAFDENKIFFGFYENLFKYENISHISNFLEIKELYSLKNNVSNPSPTFTLNPDISKKCRVFYNDTYNFCNKKFPVTKKLWKEDE